MVQVTFTFCTSLKSLYYNPIEGIHFEAIFANKSNMGWLGHLGDDDVCWQNISDLFLYCINALSH